MIGRARKKEEKEEKKKDLIALFGIGYSNNRGLRID